MEYTFVWKNNGWWLKISSPEELFNYWDKKDNIWSQTLFNMINSKEFGNGEKHADFLTCCVGTYGENRGLSMIRAVSDFAGEVKAQQLEFLLKYGALYFNENGGYHFDTVKKKTYTHFVKKDRLRFPYYEKKDIRIEKFPRGTHFYAYVGDLQIKDGDTLKWDTYKEAYNKALEVVEDDYEEDKELS